MGFNYATRHLSSQQQNIIRIRKENEERLKKQSKTYDKDKVHEISIMMKLGNDSIIKVDGNQTMKIYKEFCDKNLSVWFSTDSHYSGMGQKQRKKFLEAISRNEIVEIFFIIGKVANGNNDIRYKAEVLDIESSAEGIPTPDSKLTPKEYLNENKKIWIKITNLQEFNKLTVNEFVIASNSKDLKFTIENSQYHFGYIRKKK